MKTLQLDSCDINLAIEVVFCLFSSSGLIAIEETYLSTESKYFRCDYQEPGRTSIEEDEVINSCGWYYCCVDSLQRSEQ